jgi:pimeloyl-ACP methyl ester carboxylesterase
VASIRYDKLGSGKTGVPEAYLEAHFRYGPEDFLAEAEGALRLLKQSLPAEVPLFLAGHSEGGLWALELNRRHPGEFEGVLLLATAARSQCEVVQSQLADRLKEYGIAQDTIDEETALFERALGHVARGEPIPEQAMPSLEAMKAIVAAYTEERSAALGRWICGSDPLDLLPKDGGSLLILQGGYDLQVDPVLDARALHEAAPGSTLTLAPQADHVLKHLDLKGQPLNILHALKYNQQGRSLDPILVASMLSWIEAQVED